MVVLRCCVLCGDVCGGGCWVVGMGVWCVGWLCLVL